MIDIQDCFWYHSIPLIPQGKIQGEWDLSNVQHNYLGDVDFHGKTVREVGPASGRLTLEMESLGAQVETVELGGKDYVGDFLIESNWTGDEFFRKMNNSFLFVKDLYKLKAELTHGTIYERPRSSVHITLMGNMLLHLRDPFKAIYNAAQATQETMIIVETIWNWPLYMYNSALSKLIQLPWKLRGHSHCPVQALFMPSPNVPEQQCVWNYLSPALIRRMLELNGFQQERLIYHTQVYQGRRSLNYTIVAKRVGPGYKMIT